MVVQEDVYIILLDRLIDTLDGCINRRKNSEAGIFWSSTSLAQIKTSSSITNALSYHIYMENSKNIALRDLNPADEAGTLGLWRQEAWPRGIEHEGPSWTQPSLI